MTDADSDRRVRAFMDGIDWQHHLGLDAHGVQLFASENGVRRGKMCVRDGGGCGIVEVEVRLVRWVEEQDLKFDEAPS